MFILNFQETLKEIITEILVDIHTLSTLFFLIDILAIPIVWSFLVCGRQKYSQTSIVKDKNIANAALPAKYERTLDTPYGVVVERAVKPGSPSIVAPNAQPILKSYYTPASGDGDSCTPGDASNHLRDVSNDVMTPKQNEIPVQVIANKIQAPPGRCRIYHPSQDISLEEHRLRFPKYSKYDPDNKPQQPPYPLVQPSYPPTQPSAYPIYPQAYYQPPIPPYPYPYPQPSYAPIPPGIQFLIIEYRMPQPFPPTTFQMNNQQFPNHQTGYYK
ncbi:hypothetical protein RF11_15366 [Thelohanellus kitauei]|uniref:Uncharacterized protein n=1 Tax=Thelohanellus kitauei TaxID=669202 RepID=A0A0C2M7B3_THEKT|nr:hypothetical protein RF11_15366 [Thelohanellus kitauei]